MYLNDDELREMLKSAESNYADYRYFGDRMAIAVCGAEVRLLKKILYGTATASQTAEASASAFRVRL